VIEVSGPPRERGRQHGEQARPQIDLSINYYAELFAETHAVAWVDLADRASSWLAAIRTFSEDLASELEGIAEGAGRSALDIAVLNARGEMVYGIGPAEADGCTAFALMPEASSDGHLYVGQNWDWRLRTGSTWIVERIVQPPAPTITMLLEAGQLGRHGVNSAGLALMGTGLAGAASARVGVPIPAIRRAALNCHDLTSALDLLLSAPHQISSNHLLAHRDGFVINVEAKPERRAWLYPRDGILVHGNHYEAFGAPSGDPEFSPLGGDSLVRTWRLRHRLEQRKELRVAAPSVGPIADALRDHVGYPDSVCTHGREEIAPMLQWQTLASSIVDLTAGQWWLAAGPPCEFEHLALPWSLYGERVQRPS
jgi:isopenicillin-N N-acyltransferase-like protein